MAGQFMVTAAKNGYNVSKGVLASWSRFQKRAVQDYRNSDAGGLNDLNQAYRLYTLALNGEAESGAMNRLKESETLSDQAAWMLASAYTLAGKKTVAAEIIGGVQTNFSGYPDNDKTFASPVRDKAIALEAMALADKTPEAIETASEIAGSLTGDWYITQELAFSTTALRRLADKIGDGILSAEIRQDGKTVPAKSAKAVYSTVIDPSTGSVEVANTGDSDLFATLTTSSAAPAGEKTEAKQSGLSLKVVYIAENGKTLDPHSIPQGTDFSVKITVGNTSGVKDYTNLALSQIIPSGWEIVNDRLSGGEDGRKVFNYRDIRDDRVNWFFDLPKGTSKTFKTKLNASYQGVFILPAVKCEAMYDPRVSANTASGTAEVTAE